MSSHAISAAAAIDRGALLDRFRRTRARSRQLFDLVTPEAYYSRPITLRNPVAFYECQATRCARPGRLVTR